MRLGKREGMEGRYRVTLYLVGLTNDAKGCSPHGGPALKLITDRSINETIHFMPTATNTAPGPNANVHNDA